MPLEKRQSLAPFAYASASLLLAVPLVAHAYVGYFARYMADDYCTAAALRTEGLLGMQRYFYVEWSGRFSFTFTVGLVETLGAGVVPYLPGLLLASLVAALTWAVSRFGFGWRVALLAAELVAFATLDDNKSGVHEALYWQTGALTYTLPLVLLAVLAGQAAHLARGERGRIGAWRLACFFLLAFYAGGFSETSAVMQTAALGMALAGCLGLRRAVAAPSLAKGLSAALLGSILALVVVALAPGNQVRQALLPASAGLAAAARASAESALAFVLFEHNYQGTAHIRLLALLLPLLFALCRARRPHGATRRFWLWAIPAGAFVAVFACFLPSHYAASREPPFRALVVPQFVLVCALVAWGHLLGGALRGVNAPRRAFRLLTAALVALALAGPPALAALKTLRQAGKARALAAVWDRQDRETREAVARGERRLTLPVLYNVGGTDVLTNDPAWYVNACAARYYGAESITGVPSGEGRRVMFGEDR